MGCWDLIMRSLSPIIGSLPNAYTLALLQTLRPNGLVFSTTHGFTTDVTALIAPPKLWEQSMCVPLVQLSFPPTPHTEVLFWVQHTGMGALQALRPQLPSMQEPPTINLSSAAQAPSTRAPSGRWLSGTSCR